jgi:hypothetical protein
LHSTIASLKQKAYLKPIYQEVLERTTSYFPFSLRPSGKLLLASPVQQFLVSDPLGTHGHIFKEFSVF